MGVTPAAVANLMIYLKMQAALPPVDGGAVCTKELQ